MSDAPTPRRAGWRAARAAFAHAVTALVLAFTATVPLVPDVAQAQQSRDEQFYYPGGFNWQFLKRYPEAARLFNAFDYGHAILYERLLTRPANLLEQLETKDYAYLTTDLLVRPPRFAVAEEAIEWRYAQANWRAKMMFDWAHVLHRQIYDVYADERLTPAARDTLIERLTDYYLSNRKYAFAAVPKSMALMDEQYYSQVFRRAYPKFNGLIWAYHWLQVGLYDPFIVGTTPAEKKANVKATLARFWSMLEDAPRHMPRVMPMTSAIAPRFSEAHPRAAIIFDNLHMTHDIISDVLEADTVPAAEKSRVIALALDEMQDPTRNVIDMDMWRNMADHMGGIGAMGGPSTGILGPAPASDAAPPAARGMDAPAGHGGMHHGGPAPKPAQPTGARPPEAPHAGHAPATPAAPKAPADSTAPAPSEAHGEHTGRDAPPRAPSPAPPPRP